MSSAVNVAVVVAAIGVAVLPAHAQEPGTAQVTPYVAIGTANAAPVGVAVTTPLSATTVAESDIGYGRGAGHLHTLTSNVSLLHYLPQIGRVTPYVAAGVGLTQYGAPVLAQSGPPVGTEKRLAFTVNAGGGFMVPVRDGLSWRTDARYIDSLGQGADQFRVAQGLSFGIGKRRK